MAFHASTQSKLLTVEGYDPLTDFRQAVSPSKQWDNITDFATSPSFCGMRLYPRQLTMLKLIYLETDNMTAYDLDVIEGWRKGFVRQRDVFGVQPDIWERIEYLKARGARRFPHIQFIGGRRGGKGLIGGVLGAEQVSYFHQLDDFQAHYGVDAGKTTYMQIGATSQTQAKQQLYADIRSTIARCEYLKPHIAEAKDHILSIRTAADVRRIAEMKAAKVPVEHLVASIRVQALSASASAGRGAAAFGMMLDEFAFFLETESGKSGPQPLSALVATPQGWRKMGDIGVGDQVIGIDGKPTTVIGTTYPKDTDVYRVTLNDGTSVRAHRDHLWTIYPDYKDAYRGRPGIQVTTLELKTMAGSVGGDFFKRPYLPRLTGPVQFDPAPPLPVDPYLMGYMLGDGCFRVNGAVRIALPPPGVDDNNIQLIQDVLPPGMELHYYDKYDWGIVPVRSSVCEMRGLGPCSGGKELPDVVRNELVDAIRGFGLDGVLGDGKFIPEPYLLSSPEDRLSLVQGLIDSGGYVSGAGKIRFSNTSIRLCEQLQELVLSLGGQARIKTHGSPGISDFGSYQSPSKQSYVVFIRLPRHMMPVRLDRKIKMMGDRNRAHQPVRYVVSVEKDVPEQVKCISVDSDDHLYLTEHYIPTHNSAIYDAWVPSLDQFGLDGLCYLPSSPYMRTGKAYQVYQQGSVLMAAYNDSEGVSERAKENAGSDIDLVADPTMLILHFPSWEPYMDWELGPKLIGTSFKRAIQPGPESEEQRRRKLRNPDKFAVERSSQWADVLGAYLDPGKIEQVFKPLDWREPLSSQSRGYLTRSYRIHCDPSRTNANFAMCIGHLEEHCECGWNNTDPTVMASVHNCGKKVRPHVIVDFLHVWKPADFPADPETGRATVDYLQVQDEIAGVLRKFPSTSKISFDQYSSQGFIQYLRKHFSPQIRVSEVTFTEKENQRRFEKLKAAIYLEMVSSYRDTFFEDDGCLLEQELKFLSVKAGRVIKQDIGPVTTKDCVDALLVVVTDLLHDHLERYSSDSDLAKGSYGSTNATQLRSAMGLSPGAGDNMSNGARRAMAELSRGRQRPGQMANAASGMRHRESAMPRRRGW